MIVHIIPIKPFMESHAVLIVGEQPHFRPKVPEALSVLKLRGSP